MVKEKTMEEKRKDAYEKIYPLLDGLLLDAVVRLFSELKVLVSNCPVNFSSIP
jgi:hypothetical protein